MTTAQLPLISFDTETHRIGEPDVTPKLVCLSLYDGSGTPDLIGNGDEELQEYVECLLDPSIRLVACNAKYDLGVIGKAYPRLIPAIWSALEQERVHCIQIREKLLNLATTGDVKFYELPDGTNRRIEYSMKALALKYLGVDLSGAKEGDDIWRLNYCELDGWKAKDYPDEAAQYARDDAIYPFAIYEEQETLREQMIEDTGIDPLKTEGFQVGVDYALRCITEWGFAIDLEEKARVEEWVAAQLTPDQLDLLTQSGILRPGIEPRPYKNGAKLPDGTPKMTAEKKESINTKLLAALVEKLCEEYGIEIVETDTGRTATSAAVMLDLAPLSPILKQYQHRAKLQKLITTELPRMSGPVVHPCFDVLKETGRTSSFADKLFSSGNIQNVHKKIRGCYVAREGHVLVSDDYAGLELVTLAEKLYKLFGHSRLRDLINDGVDPHAYLGSALAYHLDPEFKTVCDADADVAQPMDIYKVFLALKTDESEDLRAFFKHWRTFAKPTGLGYPGGLGPATFIDYAKATFGIAVTLEEATLMRDIWHYTYPEMEAYFEWITTSCEDPRNPEKYAYVTPLGMYRAGATYCAAANGASLQSPAAEGAKLATFNVVRACADPTMASLLYGCKVLAFIHDELIVEIPEDEHMHERANEISRIMVQSMEEIIADTTVRAEPALMRRWNKGAEAVYDKDGRLTIWEPTV